MSISDVDPGEPALMTLLTQLVVLGGFVLP
jgi:hypothetical protein